MLQGMARGEHKQGRMNGQGGKLTLMLRAATSREQLISTACFSCNRTWRQSDHPCACPAPPAATTRLFAIARTGDSCRCNRSGDAMLHRALIRASRSCKQAHHT